MYWEDQSDVLGGSFRCIGRFIPTYWEVHSDVLDQVLTLHVLID